ncbi:MAG TPA: DnaJ C-terminal domain-containing protein [Ornithinimicrobium sp.]|uniref:DnaJ C-terminal domain-containing protein n=1 Tax=Ornithinimicrobium sp. TaxID=1977084 RepID=UPI002B49F407|nr:DnaJ C-terminal domain-containing protein [Ornithinimicrobium sp.]HKJ12417.1 DnaJ C-terminal domain-containing protein [Ornithinimicrobium sp.]
MASQDWFDKDFYAILGVPQDADDATIKKRYRKLAREWHPDSKPGDTAAELKFKEVGEAYAVLSDPEQRQQYDGVRAMSRGGARFTAGGPGGAGGAGFEDVFAQMFGGQAGRRGAGQQSPFGSAQQSGFAGAQGVNLEDILGGFAQGGYPGGARGGSAGPGYGFGAPSKGRDVEARASLTFRQAASGDKVSVTTPGGEQVTARIPAGVKDGQKIRLRGKGMPSETGGDAGDLLIAVNVQAHPVFARDGLNLTVDLPVTFAEAAVGATVSVPTLDGKPVRLKVAAGTPSGRLLRVKGRGLKTAKGTGDLLARVQVVVPQRLSAAAREAIEALQADEAGMDPRADLIARAEE